MRSLAREWRSEYRFSTSRNASSHAGRSMNRVVAPTRAPSVSATHSGEYAQNGDQLACERAPCA